MGGKRIELHSEDQRGAGSSAAEPMQQREGVEEAVACDRDQSSRTKKDASPGNHVLDLELGEAGASDRLQVRENHVDRLRSKPPPNPSNESRCRDGLSKRRPGWTFPVEQGSGGCRMNRPDHLRPLVYDTGRIEQARIGRKRHLLGEQPMQMRFGGRIEQKIAVGALVHEDGAPVDNAEAECSHLAINSLTAASAARGPVPTRSALEIQSSPTCGV